MFKTFYFSYYSIYNFFIYFRKGKKFSINLKCFVIGEIHKGIFGYSFFHPQLPLLNYIIKELEFFCQIWSSYEKRCIDIFICCVYCFYGGEKFTNRKLKSYFRKLSFHLFRNTSKTKIDEIANGTQLNYKQTFFVK